MCIHEICSNFHLQEEQKKRKIMHDISANPSIKIQKEKSYFSKDFFLDSDTYLSSKNYNQYIPII